MPNSAVLRTREGYREFMSLVDRCDGLSDNDADLESGESGILLKEIAG